MDNILFVKAEIILVMFLLSGLGILVPFPLIKLVFLILHFLITLFFAIRQFYVFYLVREITKKDKLILEPEAYSISLFRWIFPFLIFGISFQYYLFTEVVYLSGLIIFMMFYFLFLFSVVYLLRPYIFSFTRTNPMFTPYYIITMTPEIKGLKGVVQDLKNPNE